MSDRLLGAGVPIQLTDGRTVALRYTMRSLKALEDSFGTLGKINEMMSGSADAKSVGPLMSLLAAGLLHEGITEDELLDLTEPKDFQSYGEAVGKAFSQSFGEPEGKAQEPASNGISGTTSPPSSIDAPIVSSGKN